jgi:XapX domain-containing protein
MKIYLITLAVGLLVGAIYGLLNVRSPAPPVIALVGLLGILAGEQSVPWVRKWLAGEPLSAHAVKRDCAAQMFAALPRAEPLPVAREPRDRG